MNHSSLMQYDNFEQLQKLVSEKMVSCRPHPKLPINIYNYTAKVQHLPIAEWSEAMQDARGLILDKLGNVVGRPFRKFWNYEQVKDKIPALPFTVLEKLDGSLGIVCGYQGETVVATRGSFESEQAKWFAAWLNKRHPLTPSGETFLFEIIYPDNRIVVDYGKRAEGVLLDILYPCGTSLPEVFIGMMGARFTLARRFDGVKDFSAIDSDPKFEGEEGFVIKWDNGFRAKVKLAEYKRLHRLITQCSTRTIWEMLRSGTDLKELVDRVPPDFADWVTITAKNLMFLQSTIEDTSREAFSRRDQGWTRREFAEWAQGQAFTPMLFALLDGKPIIDMCWKEVEPKWATPFRKGSEEE